MTQSQDHDNLRAIYVNYIVIQSETNSVLSNL